MELHEALAHAKAHANDRPATEGRLGGKIAIVTGAAQGFGLGIASACMQKAHPLSSPT